MMKCPICGSENVTPSHRRGLEKIMQFLFPKTPYRCKECWSRFWTGQVKGAALKIIIGLAVLLFAVFYILPIDQLFKKNKDNPSAKTILKPIEKPEKKDKADKKAVSKSDDDDEDISKNPKLAKKDTIADEIKGEDLRDEMTSSKPVKPPVKDDKAAKKPADKAAKDKPIKPAPAASAQKKPAASDEISDEEHEAVPEVTQPTKPKEPKVEIPKAGKTPAKADPKAKTALEIKDEDNKEDAAESVEKKEEKLMPPAANSPRKMKEIKVTASENAVDIFVSTDGPVKDYKNFFLLKEEPPKLVVDVKGKWKYVGKPAFDVESDLISKVRVAEHNAKGFFRVVMDLKAKEGMTPVFTESPKGLTITVKK